MVGYVRAVPFEMLERGMSCPLKNSTGGWSKEKCDSKGGGLILSGIQCQGGLTSTPLTFKQVASVSRQPNDLSGVPTFLIAH